MECFMCWQEFPENAYLKTGYHKSCFYEGSGVPEVGGKRCYTLKEWDELQKKGKGGQTPGDNKEPGQEGGQPGGQVGGQVGGGTGKGWGLGSGNGIDLGNIKDVLKIFILLMAVMLIFNLIKK